MNPKISVIVPCFNQGIYLSEALESVLKQTLKEWELIIVDDGSTDNSAAISKKYSSLDNRIKYVYQKNAGPSAARNKGVALSQAPLIYFLDGDDWIDSTLLESGVNFMNANSMCKLYYTRAICFGSYEGELVLKYTSYKDLLVSNSIICASIIRRKDFDRIGGFDEELFGYEDWEFFIRLLYHYDFIYQEPATLFHYRVSNNPNSVNLNAKKNSQEKTMYIYNKHIEKYNEYYNSPFYVTCQYNRLEKEINSILASKSYNIGKRIQTIFLFLKNIFRFKK